MVKKKVDSRIRVLIENGLALHHRSLFFLIGDHARDQVVNLHYILSKASVSTKPAVLWAYKKDLGFTSHRQKRMRKLKKDIARGLRTAEDELRPFELFVNSTDIRYCYYSESERILGSTYQMLVLQDFTALTPNLLARTMETVQGGGVIAVLIKTLSSLQQLYSIAMDAHARFRTESHQTVSGRFNERLILSLAHCPACLVLDDELNILPLSSHARSIQKAIAPVIPAATPDSSSSSSSLPIPDAESVSTRSFSSLNARHLYELQQSMRDTQPIGSLIDACRTLDQAKAVLTFTEAISEKTLRSTVVLTAARGRGKSAALGLSIAAAISYGYSNVFVTAPSPENVKTLFELVLRGFDCLQYAAHTDYEVLQSSSPYWQQSVVRINVFRSHRQTVQYIAPHDVGQLSQAELLVIDEAAAIPLPVVKALLGPYLVFMSSTVNGYEGTGRSLALKLVKQLRQQSVSSSAPSASSLSSAASATGGRTLREITLEEPIRYGADDPIESWLNGLLCLNCSQSLPRLAGGVPHPSQCSLYYVERDTLFSYHKASEAFLHRMMALYVSSHYKNSPNDLQLMSDAPAHHLFVLLGPQEAEQQRTAGALPDILCVVQVCLEGAISKGSVLSGLGRGERAAGDLIPWCISQQFGSPEFAQLSGARIVRIACHPELQRMGYASRAMQLLVQYYEGGMTAISEKQEQTRPKQQTDTESAATSESRLLTETIAPRSALPPLLQALTDVPPPLLHYIGVSYGLTSPLFSFWSKAGFLPLYLRLTANALTGEHTCIMLRVMNGDESIGREMEMRSGWLQEFVADFRRRFVHLLAYDFAAFDPALALAVLKEGQQSDVNAAASASSPSASSALSRWSSFLPSPLSFSDLSLLLTEYDLRRLESYSDNLVDYHLILDLLPLLASLCFTARLPLSVSYTQQAILLALGLQHKTVDTVSKELGLQVQQVLAQFNKTVRKLSSGLRSEVEKGRKQEAAQDKDTSRKAAQQERKDRETAEAAAQRTEDEAEQDGAEEAPQEEDDGEGFGVPLSRSMDAELESVALKAKQQMREKHAALLSPSSLQQFAIRGGDERWEEELKSAAVKDGRVTIKTDRQHEGKRKVVHEQGSKKRRTAAAAAAAAGSADVKSSTGKKRKVKQ